MRAPRDLTSILALDVPLVGADPPIGSSGMVGVEFPEARRPRTGAEVTHLLEAESVPLVPPARKRGRAAEEGTSLAGSRFAHAADAEYEDEGEDEGGGAPSGGGTAVAGPGAAAPVAEARRAG